MGQAESFAVADKHEGQQIKIHQRALKINIRRDAILVYSGASGPSEPHENAVFAAPSDTQRTSRAQHTPADQQRHAPVLFLVPSGIMWYMFFMFFLKGHGLMHVSSLKIQDIPVHLWQKHW